MACETRHYIRSRILVVVDIFNKNRMNITAERTWSISDVYTEVCDYLGIPESKLFGFAKNTEFGLIFLEPTTLLSTLNRKSPVKRIVNHLLFSHKNKYTTKTSCSSSIDGVSDAIYLYLRVRYYVPNHCLRGRLVRHLYYEQLKLNVLSYCLLCSDEVYFQLAAISLMISMITKKYAKSPRIRSGFNEDNLNLLDHFPQSMIDSYGKSYLYANVPNLLAPLQGQGREILEWRYIRLASDPSSDFNLHLHPVSLAAHSPHSGASDSSQTSSVASAVSSAFSNHSPASTAARSSPAAQLDRSLGDRCCDKRGSFWLGIGPNGFEFHENDGNRIAHLNRLPWVKIYKLSRKHSCFNVHLTSGRKLTFYTRSSQEAQHLFLLSSQLHGHQTLAHLSSQQSASLVEQQDRKQYNEAYVYSAGEVVTKNGIHGFPDGKEKRKILLETVESPLFPRILTVNDYADHVRRRESAYI